MLEGQVDLKITAMLNGEERKNRISISAEAIAKNGIYYECAQKVKALAAAYLNTIEDLK